MCRDSLLIKLTIFISFKLFKVFFRRSWFHFFFKLLLSLFFSFCFSFTFFFYSKFFEYSFRIFIRPYWLICCPIFKPYPSKRKSYISQLIKKFKEVFLLYIFLHKISKFLLKKFELIYYGLRSQMRSWLRFLKKSSLLKFFCCFIKYWWKFIFLNSLCKGLFQTLSQLYYYINWFL